VIGKFAVEFDNISKDQNGLGVRDPASAAMQTMTGELEDLVARMEASMKETGAVCTKDAAHLRDLRLKMERLVGR